MSVNIQTGNTVKIQSGNRVLISAPGPQGPAGSGGTWGDITGTLSDQTDLQSELDSKLENGSDASLVFNPGGLQLWDEGSDHTLTARFVEATTSGTLNVSLNNAANRNLTISGNATISGVNTGNQDLTNYVQTGDSPTFNEVTLTNGIINSQTGALAYNFYDVVNSSAVPFIAVNLYDDQGTPALIGSTLFGFRGDGAGSGAQIFQGSTDSFNFEGIGGVNTATVSAATFSGSFTGSGANLTNLDAGDIATGTLGVPRGGTGATALTANAVLLGNGTSALQTVAPSTSGNVLTSNGTTWTSAAPTTGANPAGSGSELQFRSTGTTFGALTSSSVSGANLTLGGLLTVTPAAANTGYFSGTGYSLTGSDTTAMLNLAGTWNTTGVANGIKLDVTDTASNASSYLMHLTVGGANRFRFFKSGDVFASGNLNGSIVNASSYFAAGDSGQFILGGSLDTRLQRDAAAVWAMRNGANAHTLRIYEVDSGANDEYLELSAASGTNLIRPQATGTGTASVVRYHTTTAVFWTSGSGSPESVVTAPVGSLYTRTDGGASTTLYVKESGAGSTGWVAK